MNSRVFTYITILLLLIVVYFGELSDSIFFINSYIFSLILLKVFSIFYTKKRNKEASKNGIILKYEKVFTDHNGEKVYLPEGSKIRIDSGKHQIIKIEKYYRRDSMLFIDFSYHKNYYGGEIHTRSYRGTTDFLDGNSWEVI